MSNPIDRRKFLGTVAVGTAAMLADPKRVLGANERVRVGLIGCGGRGQELFKQVLAVPNAELVAVADIYTRRHEEARALAPNVRTVADHRQLLDMKDVDLQEFVIRVQQGKTGTYAVKLSTQPTADVTVSTARASGNSGLTVTGGTTLTFTPANWSTAQNVTITLSISHC